MNNIIAVVAVTVALSAIGMVRHDSRDAMAEQAINNMHVVTAKPDHWHVAAHAHLGKLAPYVGVDAIEWTACGVNDDRAVVPCTTYEGIPPRGNVPYVDNDDSDDSADVPCPTDSDDYCSPVKDAPLPITYGNWTSHPMGFGGPTAADEDIATAAEIDFPALPALRPADAGGPPTADCDTDSDCERKYGGDGY